jgi:hypothetical protein
MAIVTGSVNMTISRILFALRRVSFWPRVVIYENEYGQPWYVCEQARYVREPQLRAA